jgi:hypothetical protein
MKSMKILTSADLLRKICSLLDNIRRVTIGFYLVSYDIYPQRQANSRRKNHKTPDKTAIELALDDYFYPDALLRLCRKQPSSHDEILSLLKPGPDSYPGDFVKRSDSINMPWQSHEMKISWNFSKRTIAQI